MAETARELPALAVLTEEAGAEPYRIDPRVPVRGWAILSGGQLWLWVAGLLPLQPRSPDAPYIYEVWTASDTGITAGIGAVGPAPGGTALATFLLPDPAPAAVLVTAQARGAGRPACVVLSGRVVCGSPMAGVASSADAGAEAPPQPAHDPAPPAGQRREEPVLAGAEPEAPPPPPYPQAAAPAAEGRRGPPTDQAPPLPPPAEERTRFRHIPHPGHDPMSESAYRGARSLPSVGGGAHPLETAGTLTPAPAEPAGAPPATPPASAPDVLHPTLPPEPAPVSWQPGAPSPGSVAPGPAASAPPPAPPEEAPPGAEDLPREQSEIANAVTPADAITPADTVGSAVADLDAAPSPAGESVPAAVSGAEPSEAPAVQEAPPGPPVAPSAGPVEPPGGPVVAPPGAVALTAASVALEAHGNLCPNGRGSAQLDFQVGSALITLRGLRRPEELGSSHQTGRPFNCYRVWLHSSGTREVLGLGVAARVWSDTYRLQIREGLPLRRFDGISITAEDRAGSAGRPSGPTVLVGRYRWYKVTT